MLLRLVVRLLFALGIVESLSHTGRKQFLTAGLVSSGLATFPTFAQVPMASGTFSDPNHERGSRKITVNNDLSINILGIDEPDEAPWHLAGFLDGQTIVLKLQDDGVNPPSGTTLEVLQEGGPIVRTFRGSIDSNGNQIKWPDGNVWTRVLSSSS